jgi:ABC-2 type transport system ATP-binding protein
MNMNDNHNSAVEVHDLEKRFGSFTAVNRISFQVEPGSIFGFLGPNGAGKSTTIRMLCGILTPTSGAGIVGGFDILTQQEKIKQNIGYMSQKFSLYEDLTVEENINFYAGIYGLSREKKKARKEWIIRMASLEGLRSSLTRTLSVGWKQRLALGCAIIHEPPIVFLDEPTSGVDPISRNNFWDLIQTMAEKGTTIFVTTHYMDEAEHCNRMTLIYQGAIIATGSPGELKADYMKGDVLRISLPDSQQWLDKLNALPFVSECALFGSDIHAVVSDAVTASQLVKQFLDQQTVADYVIQKIKPSLEDVFISLIENWDPILHKDCKMGTHYDEESGKNEPDKS